MRWTRPNWFQVIDEVSVTLTLLAAVILLFLTMEVWGH